MSFLKRTVLLITVAIFCLAAMFADFALLVSKPSWTYFEQRRAVVYVWTISAGIASFPSVGPLAPAKHSGKIMRSSVDGIYPNHNTMSYMRRLITNSDDCTQKIQAFENSIGGRSVISGSIKCDVSFTMGIGDTFAVNLVTQKSGDHTKTSFFVGGLGFVPCTKDQSPTYLVRNSSAPIKSIFSPLLLAGDSLMTKLIRYDLIEPVWINLTSDPASSYFSNNSGRLSYSRWRKDLAK